MYLQHFGLTHEPFSIAPDPRYLFMSERHREALAHLLYGVGSGGGFVLLTGEIGAGKTTVCRCFLEQVPEHCQVAYVFNPKMSVLELLQTVCEEFHIDPPSGTHTVKTWVDALNAFLLRTHAQGQNNVLIIDEAQNLSPEVLEQLRLLTNLETRERKLLQIILIGQPELRTMLAQPGLEQVAQRVIARFHLSALSASETVHYIAHRLAVAGLTRGDVFEPSATVRIHRWTRGVPRRINLLCDRALLGAYAEGTTTVNRRIVAKAAREVFDLRPAKAPRQTETPEAPSRRAGLARWQLGGLFLLATGLAGVGGWWLNAHQPLLSLRPSAGTGATAPPARAPAKAAAATTTPPSARQAPPGEPVLTPMSAREFDELLAQVHDERADTKAAWQVLLLRWALPPQAMASADPCRDMPAQQLWCFRSPEGLALLRQLDRPALIRLQGARQGDRWLTLTRLDRDTATVHLGGETCRVPLTALARHWRGEFLTLWRTPPGYQRRLETGGAGPAVDWLAEQLARLNGDAAAPTAGRPMDAALVNQVATFQLTQGLKSDGVAGATTLMLLNRVAGVSEPRLLSAP